jgi:trans-aconitate 2-methyltransferase
VSATDMPGPMNSGPREWDAETYDAVSDPQFRWGMEVLERLRLRGDETALDAGCGSGRVTAELVKRLPEGRLTAVDASEQMVAKAHERLGDGVSYLVADLSELEIAEPVELIFSTATMHWILDHDRLFRRLRAALVPGGRLVAQCGGEGNVAEHARVIAEVAAQPEFAVHLDGIAEVWNFASAEATEQRLKEAGFEPVRCWLEPRPVQPEHPFEFTSTVTLGPLLTQLPAQLRRPFAEAILERSEQPLVLDYVRLNIEAVAA